MSFPKRAILNSLLTAGIAAEEQVRFESFSNNATNTAKRLALMAVHSAVISQPQIFAKRMGLRWQEPPYEYLGRGAQAMVFKLNDSEVIKVERNTVFMSDEQKRQHVEKRQYEHLKLASYLGSMIVSQEAFVAPHPTLPDLTAVHIVQPYVPMVDPELFAPNTPMTVESMIPNIQRFQTVHGGTKETLELFVDRSKALDYDHNLLPDTNGVQNFTVSGSHRLSNIDSVPIGSEYPDVQDIIRGHIHSLDSALAIA